MPNTPNPPEADRLPVKRSVALAIRDADGRLLLVRRPDDDPELPGAWGLPAASLAPGEGWVACVRRVGREKLGVVLEAPRLLERGTQARAAYRLEMRLYAARLAAGEPRVPQPVAGVTQYSAWRWGEAGAVRPAAERGSLCSILLLRHQDG